MDIRLDTDSHDLWYENGDVGTVGKFKLGTPAETEADRLVALDELKQVLKIKFLTGLGEYAFDTDAGVGYRQTIKIKPTDEGKITAELTRVASSTPGVTAVTEIVIDTNPDTRASTIEIRLATIYGDATLVL